MARGGNNLVDLTGQTFGEYTVVSYAGSSRWNVRCSCGTEKTADSSGLRNGWAWNCGCKKIVRPNAQAIINAGDVFNNWTILREADKRGNKRFFAVRCACGTEAELNMTSIITGHSKSCGCLKRELTKARHAQNREDLSGATFGLLSYIKDVDPIGNKRAVLCACACGNTLEVQADSLLSGNTKSCGCLMRLGNTERIIALNRKKPPREDFTGKVFGRYTVESQAYRDSSRQYHWNCVCKECWDRKVIRSDNLRIMSLPYCTCTPFVPPLKRIKHA